MLLHKTAKAIAVIGILAALAVLPGIAAAMVQPERSGADYELALREFDLYSYSSPAVALAKDQAVQTFQAAYGGNWHVYSWNPQTGTAHDFYGSGVQLATAFPNTGFAVAAAFEAVKANPAIFGADVANLRVTDTPQALGKTAVHFQQTYHGIDVIGGTVYLIFTDQGRLFGMGSDYYPNITVDPTPSVPSSVAAQIAQRSVAFDPAVDRVETQPALRVLPVPLSETQVEYHLVWQLQVRTQDPLGLWTTYVDAHTGEVLARHNEICFTNFVGTTQGLIERPSYCEGQTAEALPYLRINVSGVGTTNADALGNWTLAYGGTDAHTVTADLYSNYVDVNVYGGTQGSFSGTATPGVPLQVLFTDSNSRKDEKTVYQSVNDIHTFYQAFDPNFPYVNARITANCGVSGTCNAYWDGTINFYNAGGGCANTGEIMGVVQHEFCHGITNAIIGSQGTQGIGEGNSDVLSNLMTLDHIIGRGFYLNQCTTGIRDSQNNLVYPDDVVGQEIHYAGQVIAGFHWDALQLLIAQYGIIQGRLMCTETWHFGRVLRHPTTQPDQVLATFYADDDDGNLDNGTPHYDIYCQAASNHHFSCPEILTGVFISHEPLSSRTEEGDAVVTATITSTEGALLADSLRIRYRIGGGPLSWVHMTPTGNPNEYTATIPALVHGNEVEYYIRARDVLGNTKTAPVDAPATLYAFDIATLVENFEGTSGWTVNAEGTDTATTGIWIQADPVGTIYNGQTIQPEDDHTASPGTICWVTGNGTPGGAAGEQDVDNGTTTLYSAAYDLTGAASAKVKYFRWWTDDLGINAGDDTWITQVRNNGGPWQDLEHTTDDSNSWTFQSFDLSAMFGDQLGVVEFKFICTDTGANSLEEALIDDFELLTSNPEAVGEPGTGAPRFALFASRPNPARQGTEIRFQVPAAAQVTLGIYDVSGRMVRLLADHSSFEAGPHSIQWDGRDSEGRAAASGVYFYKLQANEFNATRTIVLTR